MSDLFNLDDVLTKYTKKPSEVSDPELILLYSRPGGGKALENSEPVLTSKGWQPIGDLAVGDRVYTRKGTLTDVVGVYPQGERDLFRVTLSDGTSVLADADHLWTVQQHNHKNEVVVTTTSLMDYPRTYIPMAKAVEYENPSDPLLDPYVMGLLLGDGGFTQRTATFSNPDRTLHDAIAAVYEISARSEKITSGVLGVTDVLVQYGLIGHKSPDKFIPNDFKFASIADREQLFYGLMDTDGYMEDHGVKFSTSSPQLAEDMRELVWGLGGTVTTTHRNPTYTYKGERKQELSAQTLTIKMPLDFGPPFKQSNRVARWSEKRRTAPTRRVVSVEPAGRGQATCIRVEDDSATFLTRNYVVTHNTWLGASISEVPGVKKLLILDTEGSTAGTLNGFDDDLIDIVDCQRDSPAESFQFLNTILDRLFDSNTVHTYDAVMIDTFDVAQDWAHAYFDSTAPRGRNGEKDGYWIWGEVKNWSVSTARNLKRIPAIGVLIVHDREEKNKDGGLITKLNLVGSAKDILPGIPDVVAYLERTLEGDKEVTLAQFASQDNKVTKNRFHFPAVVRDPSMAKLFRYIEENKK